MKHLTSLLPPPLTPCKQAAQETRGSLPEGLPSGVIYSYTCAAVDSAGPGEKPTEALVLVRLAGGPMVLGSLSAEPGQEVRIGARVRMVLSVEGLDESATGTRPVRFSTGGNPGWAASAPVPEATAA